jgi:hypothetical protein
VEEVKEGGDSCLTVCASLLATFSNYCDKQIKDYEMAREQMACGRFEKCTQICSGKFDEKKTERTSRRWHGDIKINLR